MKHVTEKNRCHYSLAALTALLTAAILTACGSNTDTADTRTAEPSASYDLTEVVILDTDTDANKERKYLMYLENYLKEELLEPLDDVKNAAVTLSADTDADNALINAGSEVRVSVVLELENELTSYNAAELAEILANGVGNESTDNIVIMDSDGNLLFPENI